MKEVYSVSYIHRISYSKPISKVWMQAGISTQIDHKALKLIKFNSNPIPNDCVLEYFA